MPDEIVLFLMKYILFAFYFGFIFSGVMILRAAWKTQGKSAYAILKKDILFLIGVFIVVMGGWITIDKIEMMTTVELWPWNWPETPFQTYESVNLPYNFTSVNIARLYWMNDETVVFHGIEPPKPKTMAEQNSLPRSIYVWTIGKEERRIIPDSRWTGGYCASKNGLKYTIYDDKSLTNRRVIGTVVNVLDNPKFVPIKPYLCDWSELKACKRDTGNILHCETVRRDEMVNHSWAPLRDNDGYVDFGAYGRAVPLILHPPGGASPIELPIPAKEVDYSHWLYESYGDVYLTWSVIPLNDAAIRDWKVSNCHPLWWIWPDGKTKRECLPYGPWIGGSINFAPTRKGLFFFSHSTRGRGGYLLKDGQTERLMRGVVEKAVASPDGCKVAFTYAKNWGDAEPLSPGKGRRVRVIDFCDSAKEH